MKGLTAVNNVIRNYINKTYTLVIILTTGSTTIAGATFLLMKIFGLYPDVSYIGLGVFLATCLAYLIVGFILIKTAYTENLDGGKYLKPRMLTAGKIFLNVVLVVQFNFIAYLIPSRDFWAYAFYFVILMSFMLDFKFICICAGEILASLAVLFLVKPSALPAKDELFAPDMLLRIIGIVLSLSGTALLVFFINRYLVNIKKDDSARVENILMAAKSVSRNLLESGEALTQISESESDLAKELASTGEELLAGSNILSGKASESISKLNELRDCEASLNESVEKAARTSRELLDKSGENEISMRELKKANDEIAESMRLTHEAAGGLQTAIKGIDTTLSLINDVAFRTNILSINAAVEAAHAGEAGKGFAVVADEVGNLATSTQSSLENIQNIVDQVRANVSKMLERVEENYIKLDRQGEYFSDVFENLVAMNGLLRQAVSDMDEMNELHARQAEVIGRTADISEDIADSINNENAGFTAISNMAESNAADIVKMAEQVKAINEMAERIAGLLEA